MFEKCFLYINHSPAFRFELILGKKEQADAKVCLGVSLTLQGWGPNLTELRFQNPPVWLGWALEVWPKQRKKLTDNSLRIPRLRATRLA